MELVVILHTHLDDDCPSRNSSSGRCARTSAVLLVRETIEEYNCCFSFLSSPVRRLDNLCFDKLPLVASFRIVTTTSSTPCLNQKVGEACNWRGLVLAAPYKTKQEKASRHPYACCSIHNHCKILHKPANWATPWFAALSYVLGNNLVAKGVVIRCCNPGVAVGRVEVVLPSIWIESKTWSLVGDVIMDIHVSCEIVLRDPWAISMKVLHYS